jgi:hypothetical protein
MTIDVAITIAPTADVGVSCRDVGAANSRPRYLFKKAERAQTLTLCCTTIGVGRK